MIAKLQGGATGLTTSARRPPSYVPAWSPGFIEKLDWSQVPNVEYINPQFKNHVVGPEQQVPLPKDWGTTGITIRKKFVKEEVKTWQAVLRRRPEVLGQIVVSTRWATS